MHHDRCLSDQASTPAHRPRRFQDACQSMPRHIRAPRTAAAGFSWSGRRAPRPLHGADRRAAPETAPGNSPKCPRHVDAGRRSSRTHFDPSTDRTRDPRSAGTHQARLPSPRAGANRAAPKIMTGAWHLPCFAGTADASSRRAAQSIAVGVARSRIGGEHVAPVGMTSRRSRWRTGGRRRSGDIERVNEAGARIDARRPWSGRSHYGARP